MLTSIGWAAARRSLFSVSRAARTSRIVPIITRPSLSAGAALPVRSLTVSAWARAPATGASKKKTSKPKTKKPKAKAKAKPKKKATSVRKKKELTPEEKEKAEIRDLKKMALLKGPPMLPESGWSVYVANNMRSGSGSLAEQIRVVAADFKNLSSSEKDRLKSIAQENQLANQDTRRAWIDSHPPELIYMANIARRRLARKLGKSRVYVLHDDRLPKRAGTPYTVFVKARYPRTPTEATAQDTFRAMSVEWKNLSEAEKTPFKDMAAAEVEKSREQLKDLREKGKAYWKAQQKGGAAAAKVQSSYPSP